MSTGSVISVTVGGTDITNDCIFSRCSFETQMNALPGSFELVVKDPNQTHSFNTGDEVVLTVDGTRLFGGYLFQISRGHAFDADNTSVISAYKNRLWTLRGTDYNILFDKRVLRNTSNYLNQISNLAGSTMDGAALQTALTNYFDLPAGFDTSTYMTNVATVSSDGTSPWAWPQQGTKMRDLFDNMRLRTGALYFIDASKAFHFLALESAQSRWGFSDQPNYGGITASPNSYQGATYGMRELEAVEDGSVIVNDALIWGGSEWAGSGATVFSRSQDSTSQTNHGRWQTAETHFGEDGFKLQSGVDARAAAIVNGPPGADALNQQKGLRYPQWQVNFGWYGTEVPLISGVRQHLFPGQIVTIVLNTFGVTEQLPLRTLRMSFADNAADGSTYIRFDGEFSLLTSDPYTLWGFLLRNRDRILHTTISTVTNSSPATVYGAFGKFTPSPAADGTTTVFTVPFGYIPGTLNVYLNGLLKVDGTDYTETNPETGTFTMATAPAAGVTMYATTRTLST